MSSLQSKVKASGKKQSEIARAVGRTEGRVSQWLNGREQVPAELAVKLSEFTGIPLSEIRPDLWQVSPEQAVAA